jgi:hypothetical protein
MTLHAKNGRCRGACFVTFETAAAAAASQRGRSALLGRARLLRAIDREIDLWKKRHMS